MQPKVTHNTQSHENLDLYGERQSTVANNVMALMLELYDEAFKAATIKILKQAISNTLETKVKTESKWKFYNCKYNSQNKNYPPNRLSDQNADGRKVSDLKVTKVIGQYFLLEALSTAPDSHSTRHIFSSKLLSSNHNPSARNNRCSCRYYLSGFTFCSLSPPTSYSTFPLVD